MRQSSWITAMAVPALAAPVSLATITGLNLGAAAPGAVIDGVAMTPFDPDPRAEWLIVSDVPSPLGGTLDFGADFYHRAVPTTWLEWGHGYTGDVYSQVAGFPGATLTLPAGTRAFYFYVSPNSGTYDFTVTANGSSGGSDVLNDSGVWDGEAKGFFFRGTGETLDSIDIVSAGDVFMDGYAIGTFGIAAIPTPGALAVVGIAGVASGRRRRRADDC